MKAARPQRVDICVGRAGTPVGQLAHARQGQREFSTFAYDPQWLASPDRFEVSPDLPLVAGFQARRTTAKADPVFHLALADTAPDAWGRRVIARAHAKERQHNPQLPALTELDYLAAVDDFSRVGALRLRDAHGHFMRSVDEGRRTTPPLLELERIYSASRAVELSQETAEDLKYLRGKGTSLGGMRPKCTVLDEQGRLAIGKFPSQGDERSITRGEVLALRLAARAGIDACGARIINLDGTAIALIERFDRTPDFARIPYLSAASMLQASRDEDRAYTEIADAIRSRCVAPMADLRQLWRRMVFNLLITNVDDHLQNHGFLYAGRGQWRLAPAFDLNPFPDKDRESKTWLSMETGPIDSVAMLLAHAGHFGLGDPATARAVLADVVGAVSQWRTLAMSADVGLTRPELDDFAPAFEHTALDEARAALT
ncbi:type II toxin-antitoxin system HipA family toxin [Hydrogenophaga sp. R2]|uniref:type II toxin-antitoxin system HipA family toxin n=1 Tax=Hydrogenophaga sp. R2 TaxID=3132827 RepID=UPI003CEE6FCC